MKHRRSCEAEREGDADASASCDVPIDEDAFPREAETTSNGSLRARFPRGSLKAAKICSQKAFAVSGRASLWEFWRLFLLALTPTVAVVVATSFVAPPETVKVVATVAGTIAFALLFSACVRRLHDLGVSGWALLAALIAPGGVLLMLAVLAFPGKPEPNKYGSPPVCIRAKVPIRLTAVKFLRRDR